MSNGESKPTYILYNCLNVRGPARLLGIVAGAER